MSFLAGCRRGPELCYFDGTNIGASPLPMMALRADGSLDPDSRYSWQEFPWPTNPQVDTVQHLAQAWVFRGATSGQGWSFTGTFSGPGGAFLRTSQEGTPPAMEVRGAQGRPVLLRYRAKPCRHFEGSKTGARTCLEWGREVYAQTKLHCD